MVVIVPSQVRIHQRCAVPRVRGMVDHLESEGNSEGNPTHAKILALGGITPSTVVSGLILRLTCTCVCCWLP